MKRIIISKFSTLSLLEPTHAITNNVDLVIVRYDNKTVSVLYGRCLHRGALLADGHIDGEDLICGLHNWDYRYKTGVSAYNNKEVLQKFQSWVEEDHVLVDEDEIIAWEKENPQPYQRKEYLGAYQDPHGTPEEPHNNTIQKLAQDGLNKTGHHGPISAMGVAYDKLPQWDDLQIQTAQLKTRPLADDIPIDTQCVIGKKCKRPLKLDIPLLISDMSFGALSQEAKIALARGAEKAGTGICSGEGGMLPSEQESNSRYLYELASAKFGFTLEKLKNVQAFHFKAGQGAKTGTGGHLPGNKVKGKIAEVRGLESGQDAISPPCFLDLKSPTDFKRLANKVRAQTNGIPIGFKLSANHIEESIDFALKASADYIILDGRGGGTGAAPLIFRDHISIPTIPALARARYYLDSKKKGKDVALIITGGLRTPADFIKALCLGADAVAISNSALQAIGCLGMRACHTNNCPVGIATQKENLRARLEIEKSAELLYNFLYSTVGLMKVMARACSYDALHKLNHKDLVSFNRNMVHLTGVEYAGTKPI